jgi:hypothetical protein
MGFNGNVSLILSKKEGVTFLEKKIVPLSSKKYPFFF